MCTAREPEKSDPQATKILYELYELLKDDPKNHELIASTEEAIEFLLNFYDIMFRYPPHIYISALPLASHLSLMKHYLQYYPRTLQSAQPPRWTSFRDSEGSHRYRAFLHSATLSLQGKYIAVTFNTGTQLLDAATGGLLWISKDEPIWASFSAGDKYVAFLSLETLQLRNATTGEIERSEVFHGFFATSLAFAPSGMYVAVGGRSGIKCWNVEEWTFFEDHTPKSVESIAFSPDGQQIISLSKNRTIYIWDLSEPSLTLQYTRCLAVSNTNALAVSNTEIAFGSGDIVHLWDVRSNQSRQLMMKRFDKTLSHAPVSLSFSPNGRFLASGTTKGIAIWDTCEEKCIAKLVGHSSYVHSVAFFPGGSRIMSASGDGTVRVWDIASLLEGKREEMDDWVYDTDDYRCQVIVAPHDVLFSAQYPFRHIRNTLIVGPCLDIDFSHFVDGTEWVRCREPLDERRNEHN